jgi:SNF family Na+-dependent transporter
VLDISSGIDDGQANWKWELCLCLLLSWFVIFICLIRGIRSCGKVAYVTSVLPYILLLIALVRNVTLEGAEKGIEYMIVPTEYESLGDPKVWASCFIFIDARAAHSLTDLAHGLHPNAVLVWRGFRWHEHNDKLQ